MAHSNLLTETLTKAIKAEYRNGCTNAGVMGGFSNYLLISANKLAQDPCTAKTALRLRELAQGYLELPPRQRQNSLREIENIVKGLELNPGVTLSPVEDPMENPKVTTNLSKAVSIKQPTPAPKSKTDKPVVAYSTGLPIQYLKSVGPQRAKLLKRLGIETVEDLLEHFPRRYEDRRNVKKITQVIHGEVETIRGRVISHQELKPRRGLKIFKLGISDGSGTLSAVWFNNPYVLKQLPRGIEVMVTGKVERRYGSTELAVADYEIWDENEFVPAIVPVYSATENLSSKQLRLLMGFALEKGEELKPEIIPREVMDKFHLLARQAAFRQIHFPPDFEKLERARRRLVFEEFLLLQLGLQQLKGDKEKLPGIPMQGDGKLVEQFRRGLPFELTKAQKRVAGEIFADMAIPHPMARLVQGDVGSGKTAVAAMALLKAVECGYQGAMMAPTEILAEQHYLYFKQVMEPLGVKVGMLRGSMGKKERQEVLEGTAEGTVDILVGTHALIQEAVEFKALGLAVTDEQHRFGVRQRAILQKKGNNPHILVMTATPIPRTLSLTLYGDLNLSVIDELPPGRKEIKTLHISDKSRERLYQFMQKEIDAGRQVYVVCPLVEESESLDLRAATELAETLTQRFPRYRIGLLHGRMKTQEKDAVIEAFRTNRLQILVSTTVVEVGVNVPNASIMIIEGAERFGLAQLHQLRGRVGRGEYQSYCILVSNAQGEDIKRRLGIMCQTNDGFKIAEEDLQIRGPGEFFGTRQHGLPELKLADILHDAVVLEQAKTAAEEILARGPGRQILAEVEKRFRTSQVFHG